MTTTRKDETGVDISGQRSKTVADVESVIFDFVVTVCDHANETCPMWLKLPYRDAAPAAMIGASNHFEVAIATATMLLGLSSSAALATVVGVLIEAPVMLWLVNICLRTQRHFPLAG
jgi:ACR3 family arsenite efflux pump ArsB